MTTDTPRTEAARERYYDGKTSDWVHYTICRMIEQELAVRNEELKEARECLDERYKALSETDERAERAEAEVERLNNILENTRMSRDTMIEDRNLLDQELAASLAEVEEIRNALGDDGRRTHKEILEMAFKASGWREWKQKYIDLNNAHIAEGQDPAGTIWEHADKLQKELKEAKAEIAKLNHQLLKTESDLLQSQDINSFLDAEFRIACKRAEKAEEELAEIKETYASIVQQPHFDEREVHCSCVPALREEVERLKKELDAWDYGTRAKREQEARKKAEAEVARLNNTLENTRISRDTMIEDRNLLDQELAASKAEVDRLREELQRLRVDFTNLRESYSRAMMKEVRDLQKLEKAEAEAERLKAEL